MKERIIEIETSKDKLAKLKSVISWKTLVITNKFSKSYVCLRHFLAL